MAWLYTSTSIFVEHQLPHNFIAFYCCTEFAQKLGRQLLWIGVTLSAWSTQLANANCLAVILCPDQTGANHRLIQFKSIPIYHLTVRIEPNWMNCMSRASRLIADLHRLVGRLVPDKQLEHEVIGYPIDTIRFYLCCTFTTTSTGFLLSVPQAINKKYFCFILDFSYKIWIILSGE